MESGAGNIPYSPPMKGFIVSNEWGEYKKTKFSNALGIVMLGVTIIMMILNFLENESHGWWQNNYTWYLGFLSLASNGVFGFLIFYNKNKWYMYLYASLYVGYSILLLFMYYINS